mmetsp:Transcript_10573/g.16027  ORF Transcript_10573/g.16027 Transcript_10573/m.16027 type:complete len:130 (+) Transcript_10573:65-454(+)
MSSKDTSRKGSVALRELLEHQQQIKDWLRECEKRIYELEENYLEETPLGNIVRGWEVDSKPVSSRPRAIDDKERLFSNSSYKVYIASKGLADAENNKVNIKTEQTSQPRKKARKSSIKKEETYDDWDEE